MQNRPIILGILPVVCYTVGDNLKRGPGSVTSATRPEQREVTASDARTKYTQRVPVWRTPFPVLPSLSVGRLRHARREVR